MHAWVSEYFFFLAIIQSWGQLFLLVHYVEKEVFMEENWIYFTQDILLKSENLSKNFTPAKL